MAHSESLIGLFVLITAFSVSVAFPLSHGATGVQTAAGDISNVVSIVLALAVLLVFVAILFGCVCCRPSKGFQPKDEKDCEEFRNGPSSPSIEFFNPGSELTIFPPPGATRLPLTVSNSALRPASFSSNEHSLASHDWFLEPHLNFPRSQLQYLEDYGRGWFGRVVTGEAVNICPHEGKTRVIVKILREDATTTDQMFFLHEAKPHRDLDHRNILKLLGRCLETQPFLLLFEYCPNGDLKSFLQQSATVSGAALSEQGVLLRMMRDVTLGLEYMHKNKLIHTDLAARNCILTGNLTVKIGDYGNGIELFPGDYYKAGCVALPVRWAAPETLHCTDVTIETKNVTAAANAWTLAVVMWEICEFGRLPYDALTDDEVIVDVLGKRTRILPIFAKPCRFSHELYHVMKLCWSAPLQRPTVPQIAGILSNLVGSENPSASYDGDFDERWAGSKPNTIPKTDNATVVGMGARIADSSRSVPVAAFSEHGKPIGVADSPRFHLGKSDAREGAAEPPPAPALDSWLQGVQVTDEEDVTFVRDVSEAIRDLDMALAMEKTSSSEGEGEEETSRRNSLGKLEADLRTVDFKLGPSSYMLPSKPFELSSLQNTAEPQSLQFSSLMFNDDDVEQENSLITGIRADAEEEQLWAGRIERGEFSAKVKEKSKSIADLMVLTHIEPSDESDDGDNANHRSLGLKSNAFGSDSDIRHAVFDERFHQNLKKLSDEHKEHGKFDSIHVIVPDEARRASLIKTLYSPIPVDNKVQSASSSSLIINTEISTNVPDANYSHKPFNEEKEDADADDDAKSTVVFGPFEDAMLDTYQCVRTETSQLTPMTNLTAIDRESDDSEVDCVIMQTPDDERSSDSGFRDKASLSESVEDADIESNLDVIDTIDTKIPNHFDSEEPQFYQETNKDDLSDIDGEIDLEDATEYYQQMNESSANGAEGWYLDPVECADRGSPLSLPVDEDFVNALRNELTDKLPVQCRSFQIDSDNNRIVSSESSSLEPIIEEADGAANGAVSINAVQSKERKITCVGLMDYVRTIDTEMFMIYMEGLVENEGRDDFEYEDMDDDDEEVSEDVIQVSDQDTTTKMLTISPVLQQSRRNFEQDIETAFAEAAMSCSADANDLNTSVVVDNLETDSPGRIEKESTPLTRLTDDVILVDTTTNEATLLDGMRPQPQMAFIGDPDDEITPSLDSSMGEAATDISASPDLLSDFFITPDKTPLQSPRTIPTVTMVEEIVENQEADEIMGALVQLNPTPESSNTSTDQLLRESLFKLQPFEMTTSFMTDTDPNSCYTADWDTGSSDNDQSSSSTEFIWKDGAQQAQVKVKQASFNLGNSEDVSSDSSSSSSSSSSESASVTDFVPSAWNSQAAPVRSALRNHQRGQLNNDEASQVTEKRHVWFKKQKYHCIYEYPREPSDPEDAETAIQDNLHDSFPEWEEPQDAAENDDELANIAAFNDGTNEDGEFFVSSTARPFDSKPGLGAMFTGSEFTPFWLNSDADKGTGNTDSSSSDSGVDLKPNIGLGRGARAGLTLDFPTKNLPNSNSSTQLQFQAVKDLNE